MARARRRRRRDRRRAPHIDLFGAGATSWFMAQDLQARLFRLGLSANAWADYHLQQVAAAAQAPRRRGDRDLACRRHALAARRGGHRARAGREGGRADAARHARWPSAPTSLLGLSVPDDAVMHVGIDAYLTHLTVIEILTVLVAQRRGEPAVQRLQRACARRLQRHGIDIRTHPLQSWDGGGVDAMADEHEAMPTSCSKPASSSTASGGPSWPGDVLLVGDRIAAPRRRPARAPARGPGIGRSRGHRLPRPGHRAGLHRRPHARRRDRAARPGLPAQDLAGHHDAWSPATAASRSRPTVTDAAQPPLNAARRRFVPLPDDGRLPRRGRARRSRRSTSPR